MGRRLSHPRWKALRSSFLRWLHCGRCVGWSDSVRRYVHCCSDCRLVDCLLELLQAGHSEREGEEKQGQSASLDRKRLTANYHLFIYPLI